jgi:hypothetical protein
MKFLVAATCIVVIGAVGYYVYTDMRKTAFTDAEWARKNQYQATYNECMTNGDGTDASKRYCNALATVSTE